MNRKNYRAYNCFEIYDAFERNGKTSGNPRTGAMVVFRHSHIGRVTAVKNGYVYTNEGNTSALYGDSNGGTVKTKKYRLGDSSIKGYCLIDYEKDEGIAAVWKDVVNRLYGGKLKFEGEEFDTTCANTARRAVLSLGSAGTLTAIAEGILAAADLYSGDIDAQFGEKLAKSTKEFQKKYKLEVDGQIGNETWAALFGNMYDRTD